jgi:FkbM family methyltransferase
MIRLEPIGYLGAVVYLEVHWFIFSHSHWRQMKRLIKALLLKPLLRSLQPIREKWFRNYAKKSYSQEGEDMLLERFLEHRHSGFYVDVGAHHPKRFSNTYRLYRRGWRGLNIDANPGSMTLFQHVRPKDINVEAAVSSVPQKLTYYVFNEPALNTFKRDLALERAGGVYSIVREVNIITAPLWQLLDQYVPANTRIDLLTVDVEGLDFEVLRSNDWGRYSPEFVLVECLGASTLEQTSSDPVAQLLFEQHYSIVAKTMSTVLFRLTKPVQTA